MDQLLDSFKLLLSLCNGVADNRENTGHDLQIISVPAVFAEAPLDVGIEGSSVLERLVRGEDHFGGARCKFPAGLGRACLNENGLTLRGARDIERAANLEKLALVIEDVLFLRIKI